jgi:hypothetical protein
MRDNFEFALNQVKPGFVLALGGDDGILPYGIRGMREVLQETGQELLAWPGPIFSYAKGRTETGQLILHRHRGRRIIRSQDVLARQVRDLSYVTDAELPMFYVKGVTSTRLVEKVRRRSPEGRFYVCPTPDGYSGIVLAGEVETYAFSGEPFTLFGACPSSQGAAYRSGAAVAKKQSESFYRDVQAKPMHPELASQPYSPLISVMTADYLLTARDLPGWPGTYPPIDFKLLLQKGLKELRHGLYSEDRVGRELGILYRIAEHHGLGPYLQERVRNTRRYREKSPFEGNGIKPRSLFLNCTQFGINDIVDAAYVTHFFMQMTSRMSLSTFFEMILNSVAYRLRSLGHGRRFPPESVWMSGAPGGGGESNDAKGSW